jgi:hypothetical protein
MKTSDKSILVLLVVVASTVWISAAVAATGRHMTPGVESLVDQSLGYRPAISQCFGVHCK